jgi:1-phosphofructokinase family hexose kinase
MILTLTAHSTLDRVIFIDEFRPQTAMRTTRMIDCVGGKGFDVSVTLRSLGIETLGVGVMAGQLGQTLQGLLEAYGIQHDLIWVKGETRLAHVIIEEKLARHSHIIVGLTPISEDVAELCLQKVANHLPQAAWLVMAGTLPPGAPNDLYRTAVELAHAAGKPTLVDCAGPAMLAAIAARPTLVKLNWDEFVSTFAHPAERFDTLVVQAAALYQERGLAHLLITCGRDGMLAFTPEGAFHAFALPQQAVNAAGAGDATSAAIVWRQSLGDSWPETLRWAAAVSAASVRTPATAECRMEDVHELLLQVQVKKLD